MFRLRSLLLLDKSMRQYCDRFFRLFSLFFSVFSNVTDWKEKGNKHSKNLIRSFMEWYFILVFICPLYSQCHRSSQWFFFILLNHLCQIFQWKVLSSLLSVFYSVYTVQFSFIHILKLTSSSIFLFKMKSSNIDKIILVDVLTSKDLKNVERLSNKIRVFSQLWVHTFSDKWLESLKRRSHRWWTWMNWSPQAFLIHSSKYWTMEKGEPIIEVWPYMKKNWKRIGKNTQARRSTPKCFQREYKPAHFA